MVEKLSGDQSGRRAMLGNQLGSAHVLAVPVCSAVKRNLDALV